MPTHLNALPDGYKLHEYELVRVLGSGGFGITYLGHDHNLDKPVAIKEYLPNDLVVRKDNTEVLAKSDTNQSDFDWGLARFLEGARVLVRFDYRNLVKIYRFFEALRVATDAQSIGLGLNKSSQAQRCNRSCNG